ncbi:MAG: hypothetical protein DCC75_11015 [Proteobacteria bacterium]|nr:MAG: hypothetical protein DCC75_11015 [Pseudomonadota bacterium]
MRSDLSARTIQIKNRLTALDLHRAGADLRSSHASFKKMVESKVLAQTKFKSILQYISEMEGHARSGKGAALLPPSLMAKLRQQVKRHREANNSAAAALNAAALDLRERGARYIKIKEAALKVESAENELTNVRRQMGSAAAFEELEQLYANRTARIRNSGYGVGAGAADHEAMPVSASTGLSSINTGNPITRAATKEDQSAAGTCSHESKPQVLLSQEPRNQPTIEFTFNASENYAMAVSLSGDRKGSVSLGLGLFGERQGAAYHRARTQLLEELKKAGYKVRQFRRLQ